MANPAATAAAFPRLLPPLLLLLVSLLPLPASLHGLSIVSSAEAGPERRAGHRKCLCDASGSFVCELHGASAWPLWLARMAADRYNMEWASPGRVYELRGVSAAREILCSAQETSRRMACCERAFFGGLIPWKAQINTSAPSVYHLQFELTEYPSKVVGECRARLSFPSLPGKALRADLLDCNFPESQPELPGGTVVPDTEGSVSLRDALQKLGIKPPNEIGSVFPDSFGKVLGPLEPFWRMAKIGGSVVNLARGHVSSVLTLAQVRSVHQLADPQADAKADPKADREELHFQFEVLMHELPSQEMIPCTMLIGWREGQKVAVRFNCSEPASVTAAPAAEDGSGTGQD